MVFAVLILISTILPHLHNDESASFPPLTLWYYHTERPVLLWAPSNALCRCFSRRIHNKKDVCVCVWVLVLCLYLHLSDLLFSLVSIERFTDLWNNRSIRGLRCKKGFRVRKEWRVIFIYMVMRPLQNDTS